MLLQQIRQGKRKGWRFGTKGILYFGPNAKDKAHKDLTRNVFCPTGTGGGQDNSCGKENSGGRVPNIPPRFGPGYKPPIEEQLDSLQNGKAIDELETDDTNVYDQFSDNKPESVLSIKHSDPKSNKWGHLVQIVTDGKQYGVEYLDCKNKIIQGTFGVNKLAAETAFQDVVERLTVNTKHIKNRRILNPLKLDPTRTTTLRRKYAAEMRYRFKLLKKSIHKLIVDEDVFGLEPVKHLKLNAFCPGSNTDSSCGGSSEGNIVGSIKDTFTNTTERLFGKTYRSSGDREVRFKSFSGGRFIKISLHTELKFPTVGIHFGIHDKSDTFVNDKLQPGTLEMLHKIKEAIVEYRKGGFHILVVPSDSRREKLYTKTLEKMGLKHEGNGVWNSITTNKGKFRFHSTSQKQQTFLAWLKKQIKLKVIGTTAEQVERAWWRKYAEEGYKKGGARAFDDVQKAATGKAGVGDFYEGTRDEFLRSSFGRPIQVEKIKVLASRTFTDLMGVTEAMSTKISRTLLDGLVRGDNPRTIAEDIEEDVDGIGSYRAEMIARTETIRAHAEGQLDAMEAMGIEQVGVMVEWSTAGDERVCPACEELEGVVLTLAEAHNKIPMHPNCRCSFLPANVGEDTDDQIRGKSKIDDAFESAVDILGGPNKTMWQGADFEADAKRPESILNLGRGLGLADNTFGGGTSEPNLPKSGKPVSAKDLLHDVSDWKVVGDWAPVGTAVSVEFTGESSGPSADIATRTIEALPSLWFDYMKSSGSLNTVHIGSPPAPYEWATMLYSGSGNDSGTLYAKPYAGSKSEHDIQMVHEIAHALDRSSGYKLSSLRGIKGVRPTKYSSAKNSGIPDHEGYAEAMALYSYPKGRSYLQSKYPKAYNVVASLYKLGPKAVLDNITTDNAFCPTDEERNSERYKIY